MRSSIRCKQSENAATDIASDDDEPSDGQRADLDCAVSKCSALTAQTQTQYNHQPQTQTHIPTSPSVPLPLSEQIAQLKSETLSRRKSNSQTLSSPLLSRLKVTVSESSVTERISAPETASNILAFGLSLARASLSQLQKQPPLLHNHQNTPPSASPALPPTTSNPAIQAKEDLDALFFTHLNNISSHLDKNLFKNIPSSVSTGSISSFELDMSRDSNEIESIVTPRSALEPNGDTMGISAQQTDENPTKCTSQLPTKKSRIFDAALSSARLIRKMTDLVDAEVSYSSDDNTNSITVIQNDDIERRDPHILEDKSYISSQRFGYEHGLPPKIPWKQFNNPVAISPHHFSSLTEAYMAELGPPKSRAVSVSAAAQEKNISQSATKPVKQRKPVGPVSPILANGGAEVHYPPQTFNKHASLPELAIPGSVLSTTAALLARLDARVRAVVGVDAFGSGRDHGDVVDTRVAANGSNTTLVDSDDGSVSSGTSSCGVEASSAKADKKKKKKKKPKKKKKRKGSGVALLEKDDFSKNSITGFDVRDDGIVEKIAAAIDAPIGVHTMSTEYEFLETHMTAFETARISKIVTSSAKASNLPETSRVDPILAQLEESQAKLEGAILSVTYAKRSKSPERAVLASKTEIIPEWQKIVISSAVDTSLYADLIEEVVRTLGYELHSISRKPDVYPTTTYPFQHQNRENDYNHKTPSQSFTKATLHILVKRTSHSTPMHPTGVLCLKTLVEKSLKRFIRSKSSGETRNLITAYSDNLPVLHAADTLTASAEKSISRLTRTETFGCYATHDPATPDIVCVVARGGFGIPVLRTLVGDNSHRFEFLGLKYIKGGLMEHQARIVTPFKVGSLKWRKSLEWLVDDDEKLGGFMIVVLRKIGAFREVDEIMTSLIESYSSINTDSQNKSAEVLSELSSAQPTLTKSDRVGLSLLASLNPEMCYATLTSFFRDADLIPTSSPELKDCAYGISHPAAISASLISPPRGANCLTFIRAPAGYQYFGGLFAEVAKSGLVISVARLTSIGEVTAGRLAAISRQETSGSGHNNSVGIDFEGEDLSKWITESGPIIMLIVWGSDTNNGPRLHGYKTNIPGDRLYPSDIYIAPTLAIASHQISILFPKGLAIEVRDIPTQLGCFQRRIICRRPHVLPYPSRRIVETGPGGISLGAAVFLSTEPTCEANAEKWQPAINSLMKAISGKVRIVDVNYFVPVELLAQRMVSICVKSGPNISFTVKNLLNGPCLVVACEGFGAADIVKNSLKLDDESEQIPYAAISHQDACGLLPMIFSDMFGALKHRIVGNMNAGYGYNGGGGVGGGGVRGVGTNLEVLMT
ncbi:hypothetical protein HK100_009453 [Physocladia obscura]|uniref:Uncharacterized protein n=1 Tax=Physocladia obscura TaxID=109957 RepID=A0AAD5T3A1_9FUNG|nr:hypothetical protein HK100_009453 [Physocladia obscura]